MKLRNLVLAAATKRVLSTEKVVPTEERAKEGPPQSLLISRLLVAIGHPTRAEWQQQVRAHVAPMVGQWGTRMGLPADFATHPLWND